VNTSRGCENCEFVPCLTKHEPLIKRTEDEVRYGRLWAEVELVKLLGQKELDDGRNEQR
jgi:hypothetical protein